MIAFWYCKTCPWATTEAQEAFQHRGVDSQHTVRPLTEEEARKLDLPIPFTGTGIEKHFALEDV